MKGKLERVPQRVGASWRYRKIVESSKSYGWHRHEEYEIAIHRHFSGSCFVGNCLTDVTHNHMVLIGTGLPHAIYSNPSISEKRCETHVIWFRKRWIETMIEHCEELKPLRVLLEDASRGVQFSHQTAEKVVNLLDGVCDCSPPLQLARLMAVFALMLEDSNAVRLMNPYSAQPISESNRNAHLEKIDQYLLSQFDQAISTQTLADYLYLSESSVRRIFAQHFKESFSQRLQKIRINVACDLLANTDLPVGLIIERVGYDNQANFNRQFKRYKLTTPRAYRQSMTRQR
ncbi:helix-turn-helix domain-containing protein [Vibrio panuliri]|uniref:AraC family transcriptional regulator n=1 Tax=Vibrio panuliri TaxID=1381081 RepID=A0ABX3F5Z0_9VIBR|nr:AraC family transcriptional regulator [Vibrio panuliri]KAB1454269.1 helix-turn-helix transcriptional regulator [Vibrio panuliri]OLQ84258.1 AraC family transcriptional regulator [Vibrio panuliri]